MLRMITNKDLDDRFDHHPPQDDNTVHCHETTREVLKEATHSVLELLPECREKSLFVTKMEEAMMWANAAIARPHERRN
jgi:hypothetical protein